MQLERYEIQCEEVQAEVEKIEQENLELMEELFENKVEGLRITRFVIEFTTPISIPESRAGKPADRLILFIILYYYYYIILFIIIIIINYSIYLFFLLQ